MSQKKDVWPEDPVVEEVRQARRELWRQGGGTLEGVSRLVKHLAQTPTKQRKRVSRTARR
jgi:hypothetical protein